LDLLGNQLVLNVTDAGREGGRRGELVDKRRATDLDSRLILANSSFPPSLPLPPGIETFFNSFPSSGSGKAAARVQIKEGGICPHCQGQLQPLRLDEKERKQLRER